ncbi:MAG: phenylalanine--tRNA ligase subunit beta, partial [Smithellaceae bacterium]|nr:phenylalanine--tRNA ligase subunit beta [Smithellaceae bacterium]
MLVSLRWLKDYVDVLVTVNELSDLLTMAGLEVESVEEVGASFSGVVVAKVLSVKPHPNADKLSLCEVSAGDKTYPVVCGAPNVRVNDIVALATVGATIPGGYAIKTSKIRGEVSEGMLCSEEELAIGEDNTGIMVLNDRGELPLGADLADVLNLKDVVLDIAITPNRADCLSMIGIAREIAALAGKKLRYPAISLTEAGEEISNITSVTIDAPELCPRYTARVIKNVNISESPAWMRQKLEAVGIRSINNVVDVTNFVMMEMGQPLHAFDFRFLEEGRIVVRESAEGEAFISLDGKERVLQSGTVMICDGKKAVAIGGIMGGLNSEVKDDTSTVLLESAYFNPKSIRKSSRWLGMGTDAAFRFERGIDPEGVTRALDRAAQLIAQLSGGSICRGYIDEYPKNVATATDIPLRPAKVNQLLGTAIDASKMVGILESLEMKVTVEDGRYLVTPPTFRVDIEREVDLVEENARLHGYDGMPVTLPAISVTSSHRDVIRDLEDRLRGILTGYG